VYMIAQDADDHVLRQPITFISKLPEAEAQIVARPESGNAPLKALFDASQSFIPPGENVAGFRWNFGDNPNPNEGSELGGSRIEHIYTRPGEFEVKLWIVLDSGKEYSVSRRIIVRKPALKSCFVPSRKNVVVGKGIDLDSSCSVGTVKSYNWDIRYDAQPDVPLAQSPQARYSYVFEREGDYTITLIIRDDYGTEDSYSVPISVSP
jgi:PKD repeat protein